MIGGVEFLGAVVGSRLEVAAEHGVHAIRGGPVRQRRTRARGEEDHGDEQAVLDGLLALAALQEHTATTLLVPDFGRITRGDARQWQNVARIMAGETVVDPRLGELRAESCRR